MAPLRRSDPSQPETARGWSVRCQHLASLTFQPHEGRGLLLRLHRPEDTQLPVCCPSPKHCLPAQLCSQALPGWRKVGSTQQGRARTRVPVPLARRHWWEGAHPAPGRQPWVTGGATSHTEGLRPSSTGGGLSPTTETLAHREGDACLLKVRAGRALPEVRGHEPAGGTRWLRGPGRPPGPWGGHRAARAPRPGGQWWLRPPTLAPAPNGVSSVRGEGTWT